LHNDGGVTDNGECQRTVEEAAPASRYSEAHAIKVRDISGCSQCGEGARGRARKVRREDRASAGVRLADRPPLF
jgi:hypothetical protein